jgi:L-ascorbate metabolism protein UlaG (beta-lactamase superfamily)
VTYLGTNGYQFEFNGHALLVDPYFSRLDLLSIALGLRIQPARPALTMDWVISREERMRFW